MSNEENNGGAGGYFIHDPVQGAEKTICNDPNCLCGYKKLKE